MVARLAVCARPLRVAALPVRVATLLGLLCLCVLSIAQDPASVLPADSTLLTACPRDCSFHGLCLGTTCECDPGWSGADCSYPILAFVSFGIRSLYPLSGIALGGTPVRLNVFNVANKSTLRSTIQGHGT